LSVPNAGKIALVYALLTSADYITTFLGLSLGLKELHPYTLNPLCMAFRYLLSGLAFHRLGRWVVMTFIPVLVFTVIYNVWVIVSWIGIR